MPRGPRTGPAQYAHGSPSGAHVTSLICWIGVDSRGPSSVYIASDSRVSWAGAATWDYGRKTFASSSSPDIFGYCGDVVFPSIVLSQYVSALDSRLQAGAFESRFAALEELVRVSFAALPAVAQNSFEIVHCGRDGERMGSAFHVAILSWTKERDFERRRPTIPDRSAAIHLSGSGRGAMQNRLTAWQTTTAKDTTRVVFRGFVDALASGSDSASGGAPQLVGLYRINAGVSFGILYGGERFLHGMPVQRLAPDSGSLWHNELFERVSGVTRKVIPGAQRHGDLRLGGATPQA